MESLAGRDVTAGRGGRGAGGCGPTGLSEKPGLKACWTGRGYLMSPLWAGAAPPADAG